MTQQVERMLPLYEAKMVGQYNHRAADVVKSPTAVKRQNQPSYLTDEELANPARLVCPGSWVREEVVPQTPLNQRLSFARISSPTNMRTLTAALLPRTAVGDSLFLVNAQDDIDSCLLAAQMNSFVLDFVVRQKVAGLNLNFFYVQQFPFLPRSVFEGSVGGLSVREGLCQWVCQRVVFLTSTAHDMDEFALALGSKVHAWDEATQTRCIAELDALFFRLFGLGRIDVDYVMETFPIVKRKDLAAHGTYRTKDLILEIYDAMQSAIDSGQPYVSELDHILSSEERSDDE